MGTARYGKVLLVCGAVATLAGLGTASAAGTARAGEKRAIAAEVRLMLRITADSPRSRLKHGTEVLLYPICISTADPRYASAVATPFIRGKIGQPLGIYLHRVPGGYRVLSIETGGRMGTRPANVTLRAWRDLQSRVCSPDRNAHQVEKIRARHLAPDFTI